MTPEEQEMIGGLVERVQQTRLTEKDPDAERMLAQGLGRNPDAIYILAQTVLVQNMALEQARAQIKQLQQQPPPAKATSFLGSLLGHRDPEPPPPPQYQNYPPPQSYPQAGDPPPPQYGNPQYGNPQYGAPSYLYGPSAGGPLSGGGGFLRSAATTAAGVAAGALAFEGIESLMHGGFGGGGYGGGGMGMGGRPIEETVINNNYYDDPGGGGGHELHHETSFEDRGDGPRLDRADYETRLGEGNSGLDTGGINSDLDDSVFNDPGDSSDSSDFSSGGDDTV